VVFSFSSNGVHNEFIDLFQLECQLRMWLEIAKHDVLHTILTPMKLQGISISTNSKLIYWWTGWGMPFRGQWT